MKPLEIFEKDNRNKSKLGARCRPCKNNIESNAKSYHSFWNLSLKKGVPVEVEKADIKILFEVFENTCIYCGKSEEEAGTMHLEHIVPVVAGGRSHISNLVVSCKGCNMKKGKKSVLEFYRSHQPFDGRRLDYIFKHVAYFSNRDPEEVAREYYGAAKKEVG